MSREKELVRSSKAYQVEMSEAVKSKQHTPLQDNSVPYFSLL